MKKQIKLLLFSLSLFTCFNVQTNEITEKLISAPLETWTFITVPESRCANNSSTGIGVNLTNKSNNVMFYYMPLGIDHGYIHKPISEWPTEISNSPWDLRSFVNKLIQ